jgi:hypothetical protein
MPRHWHESWILVLAITGILLLVKSIFWMLVFRNWRTHLACSYSVFCYSFTPGTVFLIISTYSNGLLFLWYLGCLCPRTRWRGTACDTTIHQYSIFTSSPIIKGQCAPKQPTTSPFQALRLWYIYSYWYFCCFSSVYSRVFLLLQCMVYDSYSSCIS